MAQAVRHERLLREGFARDALDDLRMHITTHASLVDRKKQQSGVIWNTGMDNRLARKQQAIDAAATRYRTIRQILIALGMDENDPELRPLEDKDKKAFVIISEEQVLGDSRCKPSWIWGDFLFIGKLKDSAMKTFMLDSKSPVLCGVRVLNTSLRSSCALVLLQCPCDVLEGGGAH